MARAEETAGWLPVKHPESILLERFDELKIAYQHHYNKKVTCVLLYSWRMPCTHCVEEIIEMFGNRYMYIMIVYTVTDGNASAVSKLRGHRFNVMEVPYNRLPNNKSCCVQ